ncbi:methyltransferase [Nocardia jinanensis]|uniref:Hydroxyneurosporene-O-methyltransferase n=1 Tax=Nocardia jinanensis TaxID=382504 RepID=A0A917RY96_9NOCA|nr:methyltransferase [Nocardia jinanensis]GGL45732.1 hydroxyneurosporene-O-methyltransferase [Nocardia jinanensis]
MISDRRKTPPRAVVRAVERVRDGLAGAHRRLVPGHFALLEMVAAGWLSQAIHAAAALDIAGALADGPRDGADLARTVGADPDALQRLLRLLIAHGIFARRRDGRYTLTPMARALRTDAPVPLRDAVLFYGGATHRDHWTRLVDAVRTGAPAVPARAFFDLVRTDRELGDMFHRAMSDIEGLGQQAVLTAHDFTRYRSIVDIGGGRGALLAEILRRVPNCTGILFDLPEVVADAPGWPAGATGRCTAVGGSFFESVPAGADAYLLKHILHDWPAEQAGQILRTVRAAMPPTARLLVVELVLPEHDRPHPGNFIDLEMLVNTGGRERSESEYRALLADSGFTLVSCTPTMSPENVLEAVPTP